MNEETRTRTPVLRNEDWWACFIGWFIVCLAVFEVLPKPAKLGKWTELSGIFPNEGWLWPFGQLQGVEWTRESVQLFFP